MIVIVDLDNTATDARSRLKKAGKEPSRSDKAAYDAWLERLQGPGMLLKDKPVKQTRELINSLRGVESPVWIYYVTSRSKKHHAETAQWLSSNGFYPGSVFMRDNDDYRSSAEYKEQVIKEILASNDFGPGATENIIVLDDDLGISKTCQRNGWLHLVPVLPNKRKAAKRVQKA